MINTAEISMFNLNRWAAEMERDGASERAPDELAIMKIVYIIFCMRQQYEKSFIKIFHPLFVLWFFSTSTAEKIHPFSLVKKFSYFASLKNGEVAVIRKFARDSIILAGVRRWHRCGTVAAVGLYYYIDLNLFFYWSPFFL